jgi:hypothetical protein
MSEKLLQVWDLWYPKAAATGLPFARGRMDPTPVLYVHAAPDSLNVEVRMTDGTPVASGKNLKRSSAHYSPITKLTLTGDQVSREDLWPTDADLEKPVILPGGEVAILKTWWHADDFKEWRWQVEFYNNIR